MKKFKFTIHGTTYNSHLKKIEEDVAVIDINGTEYQVKIETEIQKPKTPKLVRSRVDIDPKEANIKKSEQKISTLKAPLPGLIMKIMVKEGDTVKVGDTVLIMEAMKMENNIQAEKDGIVKAIKVSEGQNVMQDDVLVEID
jgi:glutaconyl-CoA/methylmalonyl-CoA decarboxylase subunit gamma